MKDLTLLFGLLFVLFVSVYVLVKLATFAQLTGSETFGIFFWLIVSCALFLFLGESAHNVKGKGKNVS